MDEIHEKAVKESKRRGQFLQLIYILIGLAIIFTIQAYVSLPSFLSFIFVFVYAYGVQSMVKGTGWHQDYVSRPYLSYMKGMRDNEDAARIMDEINEYEASVQFKGKSYETLTVEQKYEYHVDKALHHEKLKWLVLGLSIVTLASLILFQQWVLIGIAVIVFLGGFSWNKRKLKHHYRKVRELWFDMYDQSTSDGITYEGK